MACAKAWGVSIRELGGEATPSPARGGLGLAPGEVQVNVGVG